jgi:hypothetical protein
MIIDSHAHLSPSYDSLQDWDFDTERELWAYHQNTSYFHHKPVATTAKGEQSTEAWRLLWDEKDPHRDEHLGKDDAARADQNDFLSCRLVSLS